jgi:hypothetical protein
MMRNPNLHIYSKVCRMGRSRYTTIPAALARDDDLPLHTNFEWLKTERGYELLVIGMGSACEPSTTEASP